jgi:hypothetical protein
MKCVPGLKSVAYTCSSLTCTLNSTEVYVDFDRPMNDAVNCILLQKNTDLSLLIRINLVICYLLIYMRNTKSVF